MIRQDIKVNRFMPCRARAQHGLTLLEAAIVLPILIFATLSIIDLGRYLYYQSLVKDSLNQAVRLAESQIGDISEEETPRVAAANGPYVPTANNYSDRRADLINKVYSGMLESSGLPFQPFIHVDQIAESKHRMQPALPFAFLPAGAGGWFTGADGTVTIVTNSHVCPHDSWSSGNFDSDGTVDDGLLEVYGKLGEYRCQVVDGLKLDRKNNRGFGYYSRLYPFEVVARFTMNGIVLGKIESEVKAAGYLPHGLAAVPPDSTPSPTPVPSETPEVPPTVSPVPTDTPTVQPTPTDVPTVPPTPTEISTEVPTPTNTPASDECVLTKVKINLDNTYENKFVNSDNNVIAGTGFANLQCLNRFLDMCKSDNHRIQVHHALISTGYYLYRTKEILYYATGKPVPASHYQKIGEDLFRFTDGTLLKMPSWAGERDPYFIDPMVPSPDSDDCVMYEILNAFGYNLTVNGVTEQQVKEFEGYFTKDCTPVKASDVGDRKICEEDVWVSAWGSPISLIWGSAQGLPQQSVVCNFPLLPNSEGACFTWKASGDAPLLVFDPSHQGSITTREQLFGNWTFGGRTASEGKEVGKEPWRDGFEALASLDSDSSGDLSGKELAPLALWFDENRNGVSEPGEVRTAEAAGLIKLNTSRDRITYQGKDIYLKDGFTRMVGEREVTGDAVDWYGEKTTSEIDSLGKELIRSRHAGAEAVMTPGVNTKPMSKDGVLSGIWKWEALTVAKADGANTERVGGALTFKESSGQLQGHALIEPEFSGGRFKSGLVISPLTGTLAKDAEGRVSLDFEVVDRKGNKILSKARLSPDGKSLLGESTAQVVRDDGLRTHITYEWKASHY